jgi:hypothetical protein
MKTLLKFSTLLILALTLISSSCGDGGGGSDPAPELTDLIKGAWKIKSGQGVPTDFANFRLNITKISGDSASYVITPQNSVQRFDYNNTATNGTVKLSTASASAQSATVVFRHSPNQGVDKSPNGSATPITIKNITQLGFTIEWAMPDQDTSNPGGNKQNPTYSYVMEKAQ